MTHGTASSYVHGCRCDVCRTAKRTYDKNWHQTNRQKVLDRLTKRRQRLFDQERQRKIDWYNRNSIRERARSKFYASNHPEIYQKATARRRARKLNQFIEDVDPHIVYQMHGGMCGICKEFVLEDDFHVDHIIPLSKGGMHGYVNVQPAHPRCNMKKGAKLEEELTVI